MKRIRQTIIALGLGACLFSRAQALEIVTDGQAQAGIWYSTADEAELPEANAKQRRARLCDRTTAADLAKVLGQISGAELVVHCAETDGEPGADVPAIVVGRLAVKLGMPAPPATKSGDGYRLQLTGKHLYLAGETAASTFFASTHLLKTLGCRWFFDNRIGTVIPQLPSIAITAMAVEETPDFMARSIWGPNWRGDVWGRRNRLGGVSMPTGHAWGQIPRSSHAEHPEYFAMRNGERRPSGWVCTSNPDVQKLFAAAISGGQPSDTVRAVSMSPPDGRGYCQCDACTALDDPNYLEPSNGSVNISDRYQKFYNAVGQMVKQTNPNIIINHYAYADYTQPPIHSEKAPDNLCVWIAPIRYCRLHSMSNEICPSRQRCRAMIDGWNKVESQMGWREYNYNLAELTMPFSKISIWRDDIPWLKKKGCLGLNIESLAKWHIYGINTWLVAELAWDADADVDALMDDFYSRFCGAAAPYVKNYWERIDKAYRETNVHAGCFHAVHAVWTPELIAACQQDLSAASQAAGDDELIQQRVAMFQMGLDNAKHYNGLRNAWNQCDFVKAKQLYDAWLAHMEAIYKAGIHRIGEYKYGYAPRFLGKAIEAGYQRVTDGRALVLQLPDQWQFRYDADDKGEELGWQQRELAGDPWPTVRTYSATLDEQGIEEQLTWMWYRTTIRTPKDIGSGPHTLWFMEVDGYATKVWFNGELVGEAASMKRNPTDMDITGKLKPDTQYTVVIKTDHKNISELMLGGILKPIMIYAGGIPPKPEKPVKTAKH